MGEEYVSKLRRDVQMKLEYLWLTHDEPDFRFAEHFVELRRQVDLDAEKHIEMLREKRKEEAISSVNNKRMEFIRILDELEKRTERQQKPQTPASDVFASLEKRVEAFKDFSSSLDDLEDSYIQLAREINDETDRVEKRIFGEQTIIYWPHRNTSELGSLVYFGDVFLSKRDIDFFFSRIFRYADTRMPQQSVSQLLVPAREPYMISKSKQVLESLHTDRSFMFASASKFYYIGKTETEYSGYAAEGSTIDKEFIDYMIADTDELQISGAACLDTSVNLFDVYPSTSCSLLINDHRLESSIHANLLPSPVDRLTELCLYGVHFESFEMTLLSKFTNLKTLFIQATFSKSFKFDLEFLRPLRKLEYIMLTLPGSSCDFGLFRELTQLKCLKLESCSFFYAEKRPRLSKADLEQILSPPELKSLKLSYFDIESISREIFKGCRMLTKLKLTHSRINDTAQDVSLNFGGFPSCYINSEEDFRGHRHSINLTHSDIRVLNAVCFVGMKYLTSLLLAENLIADLSPGLFQDLYSLEYLSLDNNLVKHIRRGVFDKLDKLQILKLDSNPIDSIEANAFAQLHSLHTLFLNGCRLKSIDSEMLIGLERLDILFLSCNLIERIEVVTEDGRRINVAKANFSDEEKRLVEEHLFKGLSHLSRLHLEGNKLEKLDLNCFSNLKSLQTLVLSSNKINELSGVAEPELLSELETLHLDDNQLTEIDQSVLPKSLHVLDLSKNSLKRLDEDFFAELTKLYTVNLSENELTWTITEATFPSRRPGRIDLSLNESIQVTEGAFTQMLCLNFISCDFSANFIRLPGLETLRIRRLTPEVVRALKQFPMDQQDHLGRLQTCCLSDCSIRTLTRKSVLKREHDETPNCNQFNLSWLQKTRYLSKLDFSRNLIETLDDPELFANFESMIEINMSCNQLTRIHRDIFKSLSSLKNIDLSGNQLSSIDMGLFRPQRSLKHLNLSSNNISFLNLARLFRVCPRLETLNIADNQLDDGSTAEPINFASSNGLKKLVLANNRFEKMDFVRNMTSLQYLDLRENQIESLMLNGENLLGRLRKLTHLDLSRNKISSLKKEMFILLCDRLEHLDISENPACDSPQPGSVLSEII